MTVGHLLKADLQPWEAVLVYAVERGGGGLECQSLLYKKISLDRTAS